MIKWDKPCYKCLSHFCDLSCKEPKHLQAPQPKEPEQEPVACVQDLGEVKRKHLVYEKGMDWKDPLYTTPPQRKPLTDEEILTVARDHYNPHQRPEISFARAIEAAHGIKE